MSRSGSEHCPQRQSIKLAPVEAMLAALERPALVELERALTITLAVPVTAAERRHTELGFLAELLWEQQRVHETAGRSEDFIAREPQHEYDQSRPATAPSGASLSRRYGSWMAACRAAAAVIHTDDRRQSQDAVGKPWATPTRGRQKPAPYTWAEVDAAIRACASDLGIPVTQLTSNRYYDWVRAQRSAARRRGLDPLQIRLPTQRSVERHSRGWRSVITALEKTP